MTENNPERNQNTESENLVISEININDVNIADNSDSSLLQNEDRVEEVLIVPNSSKSPPQSSKRKSCCCCCGWKPCLLTTFLLLFILAFTYLFVLPFSFYLSPSLQREIVFFNDLLRNVTDPAERDLNCTTVLRLPSDGGRVELGTWIVPPPSSSSCDRTQTPEQIFSTSSLVILYAHGSGSSRANSWRAKVYKVLSGQPLKATVVTFDYRGFGDSTPAEELPSVGGTVNDTAAIFEWILQRGVPPKKILLWGHSLGTSIVVQVLAKLPKEKVPLAAVLEAPFTSFAEEIAEHPINTVYRHLPYFRPFILDPVVGNPELNFDSLTPLPNVRCPLLILHAEDDHIVPFHLGVRLYDIARAVQLPEVRNRTTFHRFPGGHGYRHNKIRLAPELPKVVGDFIRSVSDF